MFRHAGQSGAKIFDGIKVDSVEFAPTNGTVNGTTNGIANESSEKVLPNPGRPISASYTKKADGSKGIIKLIILWMRVDVSAF